MADKKSFIAQIIGTLSKIDNNATIDVSALKDKIADNLKMHNELAGIIAGLDHKTRESWIKDRLVSQLREDNSGIAEAYNIYVKSLSDKAASIEARLPLESLAELNRAFVTNLRKIADFLNTDLAGSTVIKMEDVRISTVLITGVYGSSNVVIQFTSYMLASLIFLTLGNNAGYELPKYRIKFLTENAKDVAAICTDGLRSNTSLDVVAKIKSIRTKDGDLRVTSNLFSHGETLGIIDTIFAYLATFAQYLSLYIIPAFKKILAGGLATAYNQMRADAYEERKETLEWLRRHTALLRLELDGTDPNDPRYNQLVKIIKAYDERITEYDRANAEYEKELDD